MKRALFVFSALLFVGFGCGATEKWPTIEEQFDGVWLYAGSSVWSGIERVTVQLAFGEGKKVTGEMHAILSRPGAPAIRVRTISLEGTWKRFSDGTVDIDLNWAGDGQDAGTALIRHHPDMDAFEWGVVEFERKAPDFNIPEQVFMYKNTTSDLGEKEKKRILDSALLWLKYDRPELKSYPEMEIDLAFPGFARVQIDPNNPKLSPTFLYLKKVEKDWEVMLINTELHEEDFEAAGVPKTLLYF